MAWRIGLIITVLQVRPFGGQINFIPIIVQLTISLFVLLSEAIVYWKLRKTFYNMSWVWCHICLLYFILMVMPIVYLFLLPILNRSYSPEQYGEVMLNISRIRVIIFWSGLIIAHIFFVLTIVKSNWKKESAESLANEPANLLDEFNG